MIGYKGHPKRLEQWDNFPKAGFTVETVEDVAIDVRDPDSLAYVTQTTLSIDDTADIVAPFKIVSRSLAPTKKTSVMQQPTAKWRSRRCRKG